MKRPCVSDSESIWKHLKLSEVSCIKNKLVGENFFEALYILFHQVWYQGGVKATVSGVVEDLKFKISEGSDPKRQFS